MSYEIKKAYRVHRGISGPGRGGFRSSFWVWDRELLDRLLVTNGRPHQGSSIAPWDVLVIDGDTLLVERTEEDTTKITKIEVTENSEEDIRAIILRSFTEHEKKVLGLDYDEKLMHEQGVPDGHYWGSFEHDRMVARAFNLSDYEAELVGLGEEHHQAYAEFQEIMKDAREQRSPS